uniref:Shisa N-terminal domain-containing protein n=1 Tax=Eptatretus burgeri TaxID=7764 RepID=A0A8C4QP84_EPTBU
MTPPSSPCLIKCVSINLIPCPLLSYLPYFTQKALFFFARYFDVMGQWDEPFLCKDPPYLFCCGTCGFRYCCLEWLMSLDQSTCRNRNVHVTPSWHGMHKGIQHLMQ